MSRYIPVSDLSRIEVIQNGSKYNIFALYDSKHEVSIEAEFELVLDEDLEIFSLLPVGIKNKSMSLKRDDLRDNIELEFLFKDYVNKNLSPAKDIFGNFYSKITKDANKMLDGNTFHLDFKKLARKIFPDIKTSRHMHSDSSKHILNSYCNMDEVEPRGLIYLLLFNEAERILSKSEISTKIDDINTIQEKIRQVYVNVGEVNKRKTGNNRNPLLTDDLTINEILEMDAEDLASDNSSPVQNRRPDTPRIVSFIEFDKDIVLETITKKVLEFGDCGYIVNTNFNEVDGMPSKLFVFQEFTYNQKPLTDVVGINFKLYKDTFNLSNLDDKYLRPDKAENKPDKIIRNKYNYVAKGQSSKGFFTAFECTVELYFLYVKKTVDDKTNHPAQDTVGYPVIKELIW
jgi:hypothetical protein